MVKSGVKSSDPTKVLPSLREFFTTSGIAGYYFGFDIPALANKFRKTVRWGVSARWAENSTNMAQRRSLSTRTRESNATALRAIPRARNSVGNPAPPGPAVRDANGALSPKTNLALGDGTVKTGRHRSERVRTTPYLPSAPVHSLFL